MPVIFLDRLPMPNLQAYLAVSVGLLSTALFYACHTTRDPNWRLNTTGNVLSNELQFTNITKNEGISRVLDIIQFMIEEPWCVWTLINMAYCCLLLIGKAIQKIAFGDLRVSEQQHMKDKFWNFVFYKFIFIFGVINVQFMEEVVLWCAWFSILGFLHLLAQLCKDRFEYLSFSPTTQKWAHVRLIALLVGILFVSSGLLVVCGFIGVHAGINTFAFMAAECVLLIIRSLHVIVRYFIHLRDLNYKGVWENRGTIVYFTELLFEIATLSIDFCHHLHMLLWGNIFLSMASLVICMQLRCLFHEMQRRIKKHKNYLRVVRHMEANYTMASVEELERNNDDCAICWDRMESARKLPCGHFFHNACLRSWLEQDTSCPTCRTSLNSQNGGDPNANTDPHDSNFIGGLGTTEALRNRAINQTNHFFHFDGSRYVSWLPSFSVEVSHPPILGERPSSPVQTSQLDSLARQVQSIFPHMPLNIIIDDLRITRSVEMTIENILDERLALPPSTMISANRNLNAQSSGQSDLGKNGQESDQNSLLLSNSQLSISSDSELERNCNDTDLIMSVGARFSKSSIEREAILAKRKETLLEHARKRYLLKQGDSFQDIAVPETTRSSLTESTFDNSENSQFFPSVSYLDHRTINRSTDDASIENRRTLAYRAAQQRLLRQQETS